MRARDQSVRYGSSTLTSVILLTGSPLRSATRRIASENLLRVIGVLQAETGLHLEVCAVTDVA
jgi:hypothetical protein